jgi:methylamine--corrinoid protein Co-methyltransferase
MFREKVGVFETYDRMRTGPKVTEKEWDEVLTFKNAHALKEKYKLQFDKTKIVPTDNDLCDRLFRAGVELLVTMGYFNMDTSRVCNYTEDEVMMAVATAPSCITLGEGKDSEQLKARKFDDPRPPLCQGGPTGAPVSENIFTAMMEAYAREPLIDSIVDGVVATWNGHEPKPGSPYEIAAVKQEAYGIRNAQQRAGRPGMAM